MFVAKGNMQRRSVIKSLRLSARINFHIIIIFYRFLNISLRSNVNCLIIGWIEIQHVAYNFMLSVKMISFMKIPIQAKFKKKLM